MFPNYLKHDIFKPASYNFSENIIANVAQGYRMKSFLSREISLSEFEGAIDSSPASQTPGPDGLGGMF